MKLPHLIIGFSALLLLASPRSNAQSIVSFGPLYGEDATQYPTTVSAGDNDPVGTSLEGINLWFICLDRFGESPANHTPYEWEYTLSTNSNILAGGIWATVTDSAERQLIIDGISNMFLNNSASIYDDILSDGSSFNTPGSAIQLAAWLLIEQHGVSWIGQLDNDAITSILTDKSEYQGSLVDTYLHTSLASANGSGRVFFGTPTGNTPSEFQDIILFSPSPVPEPSSILLIGFASFLAIGRRRRAP